MTQATKESAAPPARTLKDAWIEVLLGDNEFDRTFRSGVFRAAHEAGFDFVHADWDIVRIAEFVEIGADQHRDVLAAFSSHRIERMLD